MTFVSVNENWQRKYISLTVGRYGPITLSLLQADTAFRRLILPSIVMGCREQGSLYLRCVASGNIVQSESVHR